MCELKSGTERDEFRRLYQLFSIATIKNGTTYLRCNAVHVNGVQCDAKMKIKDLKNDVKSIAYTNGKEHNHDEILKTSSKIAPSTKAKILELKAMDVRVKDIYRNVSTSGEAPMITELQIKNFIGNKNRKEENVRDISYGDMRAFMKSRNVEPTEDDQAFIPSYQEPSDDDFRFIISTKTLLKNSVGGEIYAADNTYKVNWNGLPVFVIGTLDRDKHFHLIAIGISTHERSDDFYYFFTALKEAVNDYCNEIIEPKILVSDGCKGLIHSFKSAFESSFVQNNMCWVHMLRNLRKHVPAAIHDSVFEDVRALHLAPNQKAFDAGAAFFVRKYAKHENFINYFVNTYLLDEDYKYWYECANNAPKNNNANEAVNHVLKRDYIRSALPFKQFVVQIDLLMKDYSRKYIALNDDEMPEKVFANEPKITREDWKNGFNWKNEASKPYKIKQTSDEKKIFYVNSSDFTGTITKQLVQEIKNPSILKNMKEFKKTVFKAYRVTLDCNYWLASTCTCPCFLKHYKCKHIIGLSIKYNLVTIPADEDPKLIGQKAKRGRPTKRTPALQK